MSSGVRITNLNKRYPLSLPFVGRLARRIVRYLRKDNWQFEFVFVNDTFIRTLNRDYRNEDRATDVLSFDVSGPSVDGSRVRLACVYISVDRARQNARDFRTSLEREIVLYIAHGVLHAVGYLDERPRQIKLMRRQEGRILAYLCKKEDLSKVLMRRSKVSVTS